MWVSYTALLRLPFSMFLMRDDGLVSPLTLDWRLLTVARSESSSSVSMLATQLLFSYEAATCTNSGQVCDQGLGQRPLLYARTSKKTLRPRASVVMTRSSGQQP